MKEKKTLRREELAAYLEGIATCIRNGESVNVGGEAAVAGEHLEIETELESENGRTELEIEIKWTGESLDPVPLVGILTGSPSDLPIVRKAHATLKSLGVLSEIRVLSAHRTPDQTVEYIRTAEERGIELFIACAGMAAHLAGVVAATTRLPVIGVPLASGPLSGLDSLLSTVQMPPGVPVATVAVDGTRNAAFLAARILAMKHEALGDRLGEFMESERRRYAELPDDLTEVAERYETVTSGSP